MNIIIIEDDAKTAAFVSKGLEQAGFNTVVASDGVEGLFKLQTGEFDIAIVDIMLPGMDGFTIIQKLRESRIKTPVIVLSAKNSVEDKVRGLQAGGDDYLAKPFSHAELMMKVESLLRRYRVYKNKSSGRMLRPGIVLDEENRRVLLDGAPLELTETEFSILQCLAQNRGRVVPVRTIYETVWHETYMPASNNTVMVHIVNLRKKLVEDPANPRLIRTVWGKGYQID